MNETEFKLLLSQKENKDLDYKSELPDAKRVAQLVAAFYNSRGGRIVLGVEDESREPTGLDDAGKTEHKFVQIIRHWCKLDREPEIEFVKFRGRDNG
ncbi:MAG: ATP-binding protein [archaeon]|nr:ATP-binding protein [archaeon]